MVSCLALFGKFQHSTWPFQECCLHS